MSARGIRSLTRSPLTIRGVLVLGFLTLFVVAIGFALHLDRRLVEVQRRASAIQTRFSQSEGLLLTVATEVLLGTVYVRDALIESGGPAETHAAELKAAQERIDKALHQYLTLLTSPGSASERERWVLLRAELDIYWSAMLPALSPGAVRNPEQARAFLRDRVVPRRRTIIQIADQIRTLNRSTFERRSANVDLLYQGLRADIWRVGAFAAAFAVLVAFASTRYAGSLEARIRRQRLQEVERKHEVERLSAQLVRAQEEERRVIARELHDEIGQALTAVKLELADAERRLGPPGNGLLGPARATTDAALEAVRDVSRLLNPAMLDTLGLTATLTGYLQSFSQRTGLDASLTESGRPAPLSPAVEICTYRIVQEALTNVARHARASACRVEIHQRPRELRLTIEDNGAGMPEEAVHSGGLGLVGIRERVTALAGTLRVDSSVGRGTRIVVELPLRDAAVGSVTP